MNHLPRLVGLTCAALFAGRCTVAKSAAEPTRQSATLPSPVPSAFDVATYRGLTTANFYTPLQAAVAPVRVLPVDEAMRRQFAIPAFYVKGLMVRGIPIVSSSKTSDFALLECAYTLDHLFADSPRWVEESLTKAKARMAVMSALEYTMDLPENLEWQDDRSVEKMAFWDERARGMGGLPDASCAEENLLNLSSDPYKSENITIHEFSHTVASALKEANPHWYERLVATYKAAMAGGRFAHTYSASNEQEYWAEGAQMWFDCAVVKPDTSVHNGIWNREQLKVYDPALAKLLAEVYGDGSWRYMRSDGRPLQVNGHIYKRCQSDLAHLAGLNRADLPVFNLAHSPRVQALKSKKLQDQVTK